MKKVAKSFQAIIITMLFGMFVPKIVEITGFSLIDKVIIKGILSVSFSLATICVGTLFSMKILKDRVAGGKTRIASYILISIILLSAVTPVLAFIESISQTILYILSSITILFIFVLIVWTVVKALKVKNAFKVSQEKTVSEKILSNTKQVNQPKPHVTQYNNEYHKVQERQQKPKENEFINNNLEHADMPQKPELKTLYELWCSKDADKKYLKATNEENPDLKWVKICKPPYANGKFYGYVLMKDARNTVNGEIYFADRKIWKKLD